MSKASSKALTCEASQVTLHKICGGQMIEVSSKNESLGLQSMGQLDGVPMTQPERLQKEAAAMFDWQSFTMNDPSIFIEVESIANREP